MCEFISWIEHNGKILFLSDKELKTKRGYKLKEYLGDKLADDVSGHGAIAWYYKLPERNNGIHRECEDFSSPTNFPPVIVKAIKSGVFTEIGICKEILTKPAWAQYAAVEKPALAQYEAVRKQALAQYDAVRKTAFWDLAAQPIKRIDAWK